jgi:hypothetical protein
VSALLDVTSIISAESFIRAQNGGRISGDPFARQCFSEVAQTLIFHPSVSVAHPSSLRPHPTDYGSEPVLLQCLFKLGALAPLHVSTGSKSALTNLERRAAETLDRRGIDILHEFLDGTARADAQQHVEEKSFADLASEWSAFQAKQVRDRGHRSRVPTRDGIDDDAFGQWARHASAFARDRLRVLSGGEDPAYLLAALSRSMRYSARASVLNVSYQPYPLRRDFALIVGSTGAHVLDAERVARMVAAVRGIQGSIRDAAGDALGERVHLMELELPLIGGRLWESNELGRISDDDWVREVAQRLSAYRRAATPLRAAIARCVLDEDEARLRRDIADIRTQLTRRFGLANPATPSGSERAATEGVDLARRVFLPRAPNVTGFFFEIVRSAKDARRRRRPHKQFIYREFVKSWKASGRA